MKGKPKGIGVGTAAAFFRRYGFGAVVSSKIDEVAHQPNEHTIIDNMVGDAKVFAHLFDYIELFYNPTRRHNHIGGISPEAYERASNYGR